MGLARFLDLLLLPDCAACGAEAAPGPGPPLCPACRRAWPAPMAAESLPGLDPLLALWPYEGPVRNLVRRAKAAPAGPEARFLGGELVRFLRHRDPCPGCLVPVPPHRRRRRRHLAAVLARELGRALAWPAAPLLRRRVERPPQASLDGAARRANVAGTFGPRSPLRRAPPPRVWVVDDVATTGATLRECARVLRGAGVAAVGGLVLSRVPGPVA